MFRYKNKGMEVRFSRNLMKCSGREKNKGNVPVPKARCASRNITCLLIHWQVILSLFHGILNCGRHPYMATNCKNVLIRQRAVSPNISQQFDPFEMDVCRTGYNPNRFTPPRSFDILLKSGPITLNMGYLS